MSAHEIDPLRVMSGTLDDLSGGAPHFQARTEIPVIGSNVCIGSSNLKARRDVGRVSAQLDVMEVGDECLYVLVADFASLKGQQPLELGLVRAWGTGGTSMVTDVGHEGYVLELGKGREKKLHGVREGSGVVIPGIDEEIIPKVFALGCMRSMLNLVQKQKN